jgi:hypothetical protein
MGRAFMLASVFSRPCEHVVFCSRALEHRDRPAVRVAIKNDSKELTCGADRDIFYRGQLSRRRSAGCRVRLTCDLTDRASLAAALAAPPIDLPIVVGLVNLGTAALVFGRLAPGGLRLASRSSGRKKCLPAGGAYRTEINGPEPVQRACVRIGLARRPSASVSSRASRAPVASSSLKRGGHPGLPEPPAAGRRDGMAY